MRGSKKTDKKLIPLILCSVLVLQQTFVNASFASEIIDGAGNAVIKHPGTHDYQIRPDLYNGKVGFKEFNKLDLSNGDVLNFIFQAYRGSVPESQYWDIDTFVNFVNSQINIKGVVNTLNTFAGELKQNGNLVFISPEGMVVGASGVLNVGSLSVFTPTTDAFNTLKDGMRTVPTNSVGQQMGEATDKTWNPNDAALYTGAGPITIDGKIFARGNVELNGGQIGVGSTGAVIAGLGGDAASTIITSAAAAETLFNQLVSTDNMVIGNDFANSNGEIKITSKTGTSVAEGGAIRNFATNRSNTTITNTGSNGININGEVSNPNGNLTITNNAGALNVGTAGDLKNKGNMTIIGQTSNTGVTINGKATNDGNMVIKNNVGANGLKIGGKVTNNTGTAEITNVQGGLQVTSGGVVTSNGTSLLMDNQGAGGFTVDGTVNNNAGTATLTNSNNELLISSTGRVNSKGTKLDVTNTGTNGMHVQGIVSHRNPSGTVNFTNSNSNMIIGHGSTDFNITSDADVNINVNNGNAYNYGVVKTLIQTINGADLNITATNGAIGKEVGPCADGVCTGIGGADARDLTKSINTEIDGIITANSKGTSALVNMASLNKDMHINQINSDGRVILLADDKISKGRTAYDILNRALDSTKPNVQGTGISIIASGDIGKKSNKLTFIQKNGDFNDASWNNDKFNYNPKSGVQGVDMLAIKDVNVKGLDNADGTKNDTNVCAIISRTGSIDAEFSGDTYIKDITAENRIDLVNRGKNMYIENLGQSPTYYPVKGDYYGNKTNVIPERVTVKVLDLGTVSSPNTAADSTLVIKGGQINGDGQGRPSKDQDLIITVDNGYVDGYYFNMGKNRMPGHSTVTKHDGTNTITSPNGTTISVRGEAVRPHDVEGIGRNRIERNYYYGSDTGMTDPNGTGSEQGDDPNYDGKDSPDGDDDNLVIPEPDRPEPPGPIDPPDPIDPVDPDDPDNPVNPVDPVDPIDPVDPVDPVDPTDPVDPDNPDKPDPVDPSDPDKPVDPTDPIDPSNPDKPVNPVDPDPSDPKDPVNPVDPTDPTDPDNPVDPINPTDPENPDKPDVPDKPVNPVDPERPDTPDPVDPEKPDVPDKPDPVDPVNPDQPDKPVNPVDPENPDEPNPPVNPEDPDKPVPPGPDQPDPPGPNPPGPTPPGPNPPVDPDPDNPRPLFQYGYKQRVMEHGIEAIDKRTQIRVNVNETSTPLTIAENSEVESVVDISRGGMSVTHKDKLKVGDVVPVHIKYGDIEIDANVKVVSATKNRAGTQFVDLDEATANKLLYLSLLMDGEIDTKVTYTVGETNIAGMK